MKIMRVLAFVVGAYVCLSCVGVSTEPNCVGTNTFSYGVSSIQSVSGWSDLNCPDEAGSDIYQITPQNLVDLDMLVNDEYGYNSPNPWNWWIETWAFGQYFCIDDSNSDQMIQNTTCIEVEGNTGNCSTNVTLQVVGECDNCVNNSQGGTWYKGSRVVDPILNGGTLCFWEDGITLLLQPRTQCPDMNYPWGCGPGEFQN